MSCTHVCLRALDIVVSLFVCTPCCILYWSGTWKMLDFYLYPQNETVSSWLSLAIGGIITTLNYFISTALHQHVRVECSFKHVVISRVFVYINACAYLNYWRGIWNLSDIYFGITLLGSSLTLAVSHLSLVLLRSSGSSLFQPFHISTDTSADIYKVTPRFRTKLFISPWLFTADVLFTHFVIVTITIQVWRGLWNILDATVFPDDILKSYFLCLGVGIAAAIFLLSGEEMFRRASDRLKELDSNHIFGVSIVALLFEDLVKLFGVVSGLVLWRGGWGIMKDYVIVGDAERMYCWLYHSIGIGILFLLNMASSLSPVGCLLDMEDEFSWHPAIFPISAAPLIVPANSIDPDIQEVQTSVEGTEREPLLGGRWPWR